MNAPLPHVARPAPLLEIARALGITKRAATMRAVKEGWPFEEQGVRGGRQRLYPLASLPEAVCDALIALRAGLAMATAEPSREEQMMLSITKVLVRHQEEVAAEKAERAARAEAVLRDLAGLSARESLSMTARCEIARGWRIWFERSQPLRRSHSWPRFAVAYNAAEITVAAAVRAAFPAVSGRSVQRWVLEYEQGHMDKLVDRRNGDALRGRGIFHATPLLAAAATRMLLDKPGIRTQQLVDLLRTAARPHPHPGPLPEGEGGQSLPPRARPHPRSLSRGEREGELLFPVPSYEQVARFRDAWVADHRDLYLQATNPDAYKNQSMLAFGSRSEDVTALNQRWEMDATPADWLLLDEDGVKRRFTVSVIVDVWSRRMLVVVARTPKTQTHCTALRLALLAWGVPQEIVTDNGQDYQSEHFQRVLAALSIEHRSTPPFSPEQKPHVERSIKTLNHSILELLPAFAGHSVADREAIRARHSFAERLAKRGEAVDFGVVGELTGSGLQQTIDQWLVGIYEQRPHGALGMSPFAKAASWSGEKGRETRRISDERSLDVLLARPAGGGTRTLQKKGIALDGTWFIAPELATIDMGSVVQVFETPDLGRVVVYFRKNFLCIAQAPERTGVDRAAIAAEAEALKKARMKEGRARLREATRGTPSTDEVLQRSLREAATAAGKLTIAPFGAQEHRSEGLREAAKARAALEGPKASSRAAELSAQARAAMAELPENVTRHPAAKAHATPLEGMSAAEKYAYWQQLQALVTAAGGDVESLGEAWQRRFFAGFPGSSIFRAQEAIAREIESSRQEQGR